MVNCKKTTKLDQINFELELLLKATESPRNRILYCLNTDLWVLGYPGLPQRRRLARGLTRTPIRADLWAAVEAVLDHLRVGRGWQKPSTHGDLRSSIIFHSMAFPYVTQADYLNTVH